MCGMRRPLPAAKLMHGAARQTARQMPGGRAEREGKQGGLHVHHLFQTPGKSQCPASSQKKGFFRRKAVV
jgi:hypothetical protein